VYTDPTESYEWKGVVKMLYLPGERGQGIVEYALILALVALVVILVLSLIGPAIGNVFSNLYVNI
jgi:pilus assembly protein Flp/PilA